MNIGQLTARISAIVNVIGDDEWAHSAEDKLRHDVLAVIAAGVEDAQSLAALALTTSDLDFARWCA